MKLKVVAWLVLAAQLLIIIGCWAWFHARHPLGNQLTGDLSGQWLAYGRLAGLLAAFGCLLQVVLTGRVIWVERAFGLDRLTRLHHLVGWLLLLPLAAHPVLVTAGHAAQADSSFAAQYADFLKNWEDVAGATVGLALMLAALAFCVLGVLKWLKYEWWHATHLTLYVAIALAFGHQLTVGSDLAGNRWFRLYWLVLYVAVLVSVVGFRLVRPLWAYARHRFTVERLVLEAPDVTSVWITGRHLERFRAAAGQFVIVRFLAPGFRWEAHPFSLSRPPDGHSLRLTIRRLGDFTARIPELPVGTRVIIDGPHGVFTATHCRQPKVLLIAGGIGITPIRAVAEDLLREGRDVILICANRQENVIVFRQELDDLVAAAAGRLRVIHVLNHDPAWTGEKGVVDRDRLARLVPDLSEREVYLCGPPPMMKGIRAVLRELGLPRGRLHWERFAL